MSKKFNAQTTTEVTGDDYSSVLGKRPQLNHPINCKQECHYGYDRAFCFPCMKKILEEHKAAKQKKL